MHYWVFYNRIFKLETNQFAKGPYILRVVEGFAFESLGVKGMRTGAPVLLIQRIGRKSRHGVPASSSHRSS